MSGITDVIATWFVCAGVIALLTACFMSVLAWFSGLEDWQMCRLWFGIAIFGIVLVAVLEAAGISID